MQDAIICLPEEEMKLRDEHKKFFAEEIARQLSEVVDSFKPHGWRKLAHVLRALGPIATSIGIVVALLGITLGSLYYSFSKVKEEATFQTNTESKLEKLNTDMVSLRALIASSQPLKSQNQKAAKELLAQARQKLVPPIPKSVVEQAGINFIEAASKEPTAWNAALAFLEYRSFLNASETPNITDPLIYKAQGRIHGDWDLNINGSGGDEFLSITNKFVLARDAARYEKIDEELNQGKQLGPLRIGFGGINGNREEVYIDGFRLKNVTLQGVRVVYKGGPVILESVYFVDCTFDFQKSPNRTELAKQILSGSAISYTAPG